MPRQALRCATSARCCASLPLLLIATCTSPYLTCTLSASTVFIQCGPIITLYHYHFTTLLSSHDGCANGNGSMDAHSMKAMDNHVAMDGHYGYPPFVYPHTQSMWCNEPTCALHEAWWTLFKAFSKGLPRRDSVARRWLASIICLCPTEELSWLQEPYTSRGDALLIDSRNVVPIQSARY